MRLQPSSLRSLLFVTICALVLNACASAPAGPPPTPTVEGITAMVPPSAFVDFTLTSQDNKPISLGQLKGKPVLMIFGFTNCPDVCPITLGNFKQVRLLLQDKGKADAIHYLFISVDGARDNPERLKYYLSQFDPSFEGMMGDDSQLRVIVRQYGATFTLENVGGMKKENYSVSHTASSFLLDKDGNWIRKYAYQTAPELIANDILSVLG